MCWLASWVQKYLKLSPPNVSVFCFFWGGGGVLSHRIVTTKTCHHCFGSDKKEHIILIFGGNKLNFSTVMQFFCILVCFSSLLVFKLKFCNLMWLQSITVTTENVLSYETWDVLSRIKYTELSPKGRDTPSRRSANVGPTASDGRASLFGVFHSSALIGLMSVAVWICVGAVGTVGERENSDWMFSLANESVPDNYSQSDENKHTNEGGTDRRLFKCYVIFPNHSNTRMFS